MFQATLVAPSTDNPVKRQTVSGKIERLIRIPVLRSTLRNGDIIGDNDLNWISVPERNIQHDVLLKREDLTGMTPRRMASAGKPLLAGEVERPKIVKRGDMITITFTDGPLVLTTKGKALQTGARGDMIRIANLNSSKSLQGFVTGKKEVTVR